MTDEQRAIDQRRAWWSVLSDPNSTPEEKAEAHQWLEDEGL
jgi:hypothetical protein